MLRHVAILTLFMATAAHADFWPTFPQNHPNWTRKAQVLGNYFHQVAHPGESFGDQAIPQAFTNDPKNAIMVDPRSAVCAASSSTDRVSYNIDLTENGKVLYPQTLGRGELASKQLLNCGQALLRAGNTPGKIPLNQILNNVTNQANLKQSIDLNAARIKIVPDEWDTAYYTLMVDDRYPALKLSAQAAAKAHEQLDRAREEGKMVTVNFKHSLFDSGLTLSSPALTASADPAVTGAVGNTSSAH